MTSARRAWLFVAFLAVAVGGAVVLRDTYRGPRDPVQDGGGGPGPTPPPADGVARGQFLAFIRSPGSPQEGREARALAEKFCSGLLGRESEIATARARMRTVRVLATGHEFDSDVALSYEQERPGLARASLDVHPFGGKPATYSWLVVPGRKDGETQFLVPPGAQPRPLLESSRIPISIGDLRVRDMTAIYRAVRRRDVQALGWVAEPGSRRLLALEALLRPDSSSLGLPDGEMVPAADSADANERAIFYVEEPDLTLHSVRVFDGSQKMVRAYEDFLYETVRKSPRIKRFRATSFVDGSHTVFDVQSSSVAYRGTAPR
jgi:hypothetical protein